MSEGGFIMADKKLLTIEGLEEYNTKWHERLEDIAIDNEAAEEIADDALPYVWKIKIKASEAAIPFNLYGQDNITLFVNWGDGTSSTITSSGYASDPFDNYDAPSFHTYSSNDEYIISISSNDWKNTYILTAFEDIDQPDPIYGSYQSHLVEVVNALPKVKGTNRPNYGNYSELITQENKFDYLFEGCTNLVKIPSDLFAKNESVTSFKLCFFDCYKLAFIPSNLFEKNTECTTFSECFSHCRALQYVPNVLFKHNTKANDFSSCFNGCYNITTVFPNLFYYNTLLTNLNYCFEGCSNLTKFNLCIQSPNIQWASNFVPYASNDERIVSVPANSTTYTTLSSMASSRGIIVSTDINACQKTWEFTVYSDRTSIPFNLYNVSDTTLIVDWGDGTISKYTSADYSSYNTQYTHNYNSYDEYSVIVMCNNWSDVHLFSFTNSAWYGSVTSIDSPLPHLKGVRTSSSTVYDNKLDYAFYNCRNLVSIPENIFYNNPNVTSFKSTFSSCTNITSIPENIFSNNTMATDFSYCFYNCNSLTSIPSNLFANNTLVTTFQSCFSGLNLTSIPSSLFANNTAVTNFSECFSTCISLTSIPSNLFANNTAVTNFSECFSYCRYLVSVPSGLFANNTAVTTFSRCFYVCSKFASVPSGLFANNTAVTNFKECFYYTSLNDFTLHIGSANVSNCSSFVQNRNNTTRTIYVPANSKTQTTFSNVSSSLGLTIIGE